MTKDETALFARVAALEAEVAALKARLEPSVGIKAWPVTDFDPREVYITTSPLAAGIDGETLHLGSIQ